MIYRLGCALVALLFASSLLRADDWPQWRGPGRDGHVATGAVVPLVLPAAPKVVWHVPLGNGLSSPVVAGGKVFCVDNSENKETVRAFDAASGKVLWGVPLDELHKDSQSVAGPRCTPLVDGDRVYAQSCRGELQCLSAADGKVVWRTNYVKDHGASFIGEKGKAAGSARHGYDASPLIDGGHLIAGVGGRPGGGVVCFDKLTGNVVWKAADDTPAYAAPIIATVAGKRQYIAFMVEGVIALDPADGTLLWRVPVKTSLGRHVTTPVVVGDVVVVASHEAGMIGIRVTADGAGLKAERAWTSKESAINFSSPVAVGEYLYGVGPNKNLICVEAATGAQQWSKAGYFAGDGGHAHGGLIAMGANVLLLTDGGQIVLFAAAPQAYKEVNRVQVAGTNWCNPAYADGKLYLRDGRELWCVHQLP